MLTAYSSTAATARKSLFLEQVADPNMLREAWYRVQRGGKAAGVDGMTVDAFRPYAERRLADLAEALVTDTYRPSILKRVQIPKPSGGWRILGMPTITDRIAQTAAALVIHDRITALFSDRSFAYRPFLGPRRAAVFLRTAVASAAWAVTADIEKFFDNVEHRILADQLRNVGMDEAGVRLILRWLLSPAQERGRQFQPVKGLPQGSPVAPVLANLYLTGFDTALEAEGFAHIRYADDFVVLAAEEADAQRALRYVSTYLSTRLRLRIKPAKTQLTRAEEGFDFVGFRFTRTAWTIPSASIARFQETVSQVLAEGDRRTVANVAKSHNDLVRGWRNYYFGNSPEMDRQVGDLEAWRAEACRAYLARIDLDPDSAAIWFERLPPDGVAETPPGTYAVETSSNDEIGAVSSGADEWHERKDEPAEARRDRTFSTQRQLRDAEIGRKQQPTLLEDGWLRVPTFGGFVTKARSLIVVRRKKQVIFECALDDIACVTVEADGVVLSTTLMDECAKRQIPIVLCRVSGNPVAHMLPIRAPLMVGLAQKQLVARNGKTGTALVRSILAAKISNQRALLLYHAKYRHRHEGTRKQLLSSAAAIGDYLRQVLAFPGVPLRIARQALFLLEAKAAAHYWRGFGALVPRELRFLNRQHREAKDAVNKALSYGYGLLRGHVWIAARRAGLDPSIGLLHTGRKRSAGLVFDLLEPFRQPVVDKTVLALIGRGCGFRKF